VRSIARFHGPRGLPRYSNSLRNACPDLPTPPRKLVRRSHEHAETRSVERGRCYHISIHAGTCLLVTFHIYPHLPTETISTKQSKGALDSSRTGMHCYRITSTIRRYKRRSIELRSITRHSCRRQEGSTYLPVLRLEQDTIWSAKSIYSGGDSRTLPSIGCFGRLCIGENSTKTLRVELEFARLVGSQLGPTRYFPRERAFDLI
jgi:hypothetical protein